MDLKIVGIDLAKNVFHLIGMDAKGHIILKKRLMRASLLPYIANLPSCCIGMEACSGASYWARKFEACGHEVKLMSPQYVKPYVKTNKNDYKDAEAICEAMTRPTMRYVTPKSIEQQDIQALHRIRQRYIQERTALVNQIRGLLHEYGTVIPQGVRYVRTRLPDILTSSDEDLSMLMRELFSELYEELKRLDQRIKDKEMQIERLCQQSQVCQRLTQIPGIGPLTATAIIAAVGDAKAFKNGRHLSAWLGLVPRQYSTGGKQMLLGISKRGDRYIRTLLIHGARAVVSVAKARSQWLNSLIARQGKQKAYVALANKNARMIWALIVKETGYYAV